MPEPDDRLLIRWRTLGVAFVVVGAVTAVGVRWWQTGGGDLPLVSPLLAALLLLVGAIVLLLGLRVRRWVRKGEVIDGPGATRTLVLGQTAALAGAIVAGAMAALAVLALLHEPAPLPRLVALQAGGNLLASAAMAVAGMVAQWCCRVPADGDDGDDDRPVGA